MNRHLETIGYTFLCLSFLIFCFWLDAAVDPYLFESINHYWVSNAVLFITWAALLLVALGLITCSSIRSKRIALTES